MEALDRIKLLDKFLSAYYFSGHYNLRRIEFISILKETDNAKTH